jgi:D-alanyl-D-alanine carboxypeptidase/D-alanyl-D-alanine-endopeptidase (penicillin-binding protein 4)
MKVLTALVALDTLGADARFTTSVVSSGRRLVLVGGGDPMLTDKPSKSAAKAASLQALAEQTAKALSRAGVSKVTLDWDTSLFTGPDWSPGWPASWKTFTVRVSPLSVNGGRVNRYQAHADPARAAAEAFAKRLKAAGVSVTLGGRRTAGDGEVVAEVDSAPLTEVIGATLRNSDNFAAEVLARHAALAAGSQPSFTGASKAMTRWLQSRDWWVDGMVAHDGSGLSRQNRISPSVLAKAISGMLVTPSLAGVGKGFPVAGVNGTLKERFDDPSEAAGRGTVHAKTGTLAGVASLAGYLVDADGATLVFAAMANQAVGQDTAYNWLDRTAAVLAGCGCR